ncbi:MAG: hypothetical protein AN484_26110, partial [Aphanizomenon flos-aquae WA102]
ISEEKSPSDTSPSLPPPISSKTVGVLGREGEGGKGRNTVRRNIHQFLLVNDNRGDKVQGGPQPMLLHAGQNAPVSCRHLGGQDPWD